MRVAKCDFMKPEIKYFGRVVSAEGIKPDPKAVSKLRDWEILRNKTEMQSFLGFANYYRELILGTPNWWLPCMRSLASKPLLPRDLSRNWLSTK